MQQEQRIAHTKITSKFGTGGGQLLFAGGQGGEVWDTGGKTYLDFVMGYGPVILGHAVGEFTDRFQSRLANGVMMPGYTVFHEEYLGRLLAGRPDTRGALFKTASEAVTAAFRVAALETGKVGVIRSGYVGWHDAQIANSLKWHEPLHSPLRNALRYTEHMRGVGSQEPALNWVDLRLDSLAQLIDQHQHRLGCFVFDAYLASLTTPGLLREAVEMCRSRGLITMFDETKTGGRISRLGYAHDFDIGADLVVIGKALANGAPLSILFGSRKLLAHTERARLSGTFSKEMLAMYAALATLDLMEKPIGQSADGWEEVSNVGIQVAATITEAAKEVGVDSMVWAQPVLGGGMFELVYSDELLGDRARRSALLAAFTGAGILLLEGHPSFVCLAHRDLDWTQLKQRASRALQQWSTAVTHK